MEMKEAAKNYLDKWCRRSRVERMLLVEAFVLLAAARLAVRVLPFRWLAASLGGRMKTADAAIGPAELDIARKVGQAVRSAANYTLWESVCLPQAVAGYWMLRRRRIAATVYVGVARERVRRNRLFAHAWLRCGDLVLTGGAGHQQFTVVATFS